MDHPKSISAPFRSLLFHLTDIELIVQPVKWCSDKEAIDFHTLLVSIHGNGSLHIDNDDFRLFPGKCYMFTPGSSVQIENNGYDSEIIFYQITFSTIQVGNQQHETYTGDIFFDRHELVVFPFSRLLRFTEELYAGKLNNSDIEWFKQHLIFQELLGFLMGHNLHCDQELTSTQSVESTIQYLRNNYSHDITVKQLAELANVPHWKYTPIFKELTGKKPLDFLTELRINHSKELLMHSNDCLREIAHRVGFADEFYFNRRFRQKTGTTPRQYAISMRQSVYVKDWTGHEVAIPAQPKRIIFHSETFGDLLVLGVKAVGGVYSCIAQSLFEEWVRNVQDVGFPINFDKIIEIKPDLIIFSNADEIKYQKLSQIAPTLTFNSFAPLDQRLQTLGEWFDRKRKATEWLDVYHTKAVSMWKQLSSEIKPGETASVFIFDHGKRIFVMGTSGFSSALYHPLGFQPVDKIQEVLDSGEGFVEISTASLPMYAGDRIFMLLPENAVSRQAAKDLMNDELWHNLPAVQNGYAYIVEANKWNYGDALIREKMLDMLPDLLLKTP